MENLNTKEAASFCRLAETTLEKLRCFGGGPRYLKIGRKAVRYRADDLREWLNSKLANSTSEYTGRN